MAIWARNAPLLSASAAAASLKLRARRAGEREPALLAAAQALESYSADKDAEFTLRDALANEFALANRVPEAVEAYSRAVELGSSVASVNHLHAAIRLSQLTRGSDSLRSLECANRAVELARAASDFPHTERVRALAELGIAIADTKDVRAAFPVWRDAAAELLASEPQTDLERCRFAEGRDPGRLSFAEAFPPRR